MPTLNFVGIGNVECPNCQAVVGITWKATVTDEDGYVALAQPSMEGQPHTLDDIPLSGHPIAQRCQQCNARFSLEGTINTTWSGGTLDVIPLETA